MVVALLLDASGSMSSQKGEALKGINEYIKTLKKDYEDHPENGEIYLSLVTFSSTFSDKNDWTKFIYNLTPITEVEKVPSSVYNPNGGTPLLRSISKVIETLEGYEERDEVKAGTALEQFFSGEEDLDTKIVVVIQTDGGETEHSPDFSKEKVSQLISDKEKKGNWTFVFLGQGIDAVKDGLAFGVSANSSFSFSGEASSPRSYSSVYAAGASVTSSLRKSSVMRSENFSASLSAEIEKSTKPNKKK